LDLLTKQLLARLTRLWGWNNLNTFFKTISRYLEIVVEKSIRGCQIFRGTKKYWVKMYQHCHKNTNWPNNIPTQMPKNIPNGHEMYQNFLTQGL
jgi:hypothetical protein